METQNSYETFNDALSDFEDSFIMLLREWKSSIDKDNKLKQEALEIFKEIVGKYSNDKIDIEFDSIKEFEEKYNSLVREIDKILDEKEIDEIDEILRIYGPKIKKLEEKINNKGYEVINEAWKNADKVVKIF